jgi:hypothetical protein
MRQPTPSVITAALSGRFWLITGIGLILALIIAANGHFLYVAFTTQPGCLEESAMRQPDGSLQRLAPGRKGC